MAIDKALAELTRLVRAGDIAEAVRLGSEHSPSLAADKALFHNKRKLATGSESTIFEVEYKGEQLVLKQAVIRCTADLERFRRELSCLCSLRHSNIIALLAARAVPPDYGMLLPKYPYSLEALIHHEGWRPDWQLVLHISLQLAQALAAVHKAGYVHRDIKPGNVLVDYSASAVLADFGLVAMERDLRDVISSAPSGGFHKQRIVGTLQYLAPEVLQNHHHMKASDVYALAVTMNELATGTIPFSDCTKDNPACHTILDAGYGHMELASAVAAEQLRPTLPRGAPPRWLDLMSKCWAEQASSRPSAEDVAAGLRDLLASEGGAPGSTTAQSAMPAAGSSNAHASAAANGNSDVGARTGGLKLSFTCNTCRSDIPVAAWESAVGDDSGLAMVCGAYADAGLRGRDKMEDRYVLASPLRGARRAHLLAVFDGHRGAEAADMLASSFSEAVLSCWPSAHGAEEVLSAALLQCENSFCESQEGLWRQRVLRMGSSAAGVRRYPGATALAVLQIGSLVAVANVGDCRAVVCRGGNAVALTTDHVMDRDSERNRAVASGARVQCGPDGAWRVGAAQLAVSRCIGDIDVKSEGGVVATPETSAFVVSDEDEFLILATDGLWDVVSNEDAVALVHDTVKNPSMASKRIVLEALARGSRDNVTCIVAFLQNVETLESIYKDGCQKYQVAKTLYGSRAEMLAAYAQSSAMDEVMEQY